MARTVITYHSNDETFARKLAKDLDGCGAQPWLDVNGPHGGASFSDLKRRSLAQYAAMLLIVSPAAIESIEVRQRWYEFLTKGRPLYLVLHKKAEIPPRLANQPVADFERQPYETAFRQLHAALRAGGLPLAPLTWDDEPAPLPPRPVRKSNPLLRAAAVVLGLALVVAFIWRGPDLLHKNASPSATPPPTHQVAAQPTLNPDVPTLSAGEFGQDQLPTLSPTPTQSPTAAPPTATPSITPTPSPSPTQTLTATPMPCTVRAEREYVQIRVGPGENRLSRGAMLVDELVPVAGWAAADDGSLWWQIHPPDYSPEEANRYWVNQAEVVAEGACEQINESEPPPLITEN